jgi:hypothetical protein
MLARAAATLDATLRTWVNRAGLLAAVEEQKAELTSIRRHPAAVAASHVHFDDYEGYLNALLGLPITSTTVPRSCFHRLSLARLPRPCREGGDDDASAMFDWGYPSQSDKGWCDAFGTGTPNDYIRRVGDGDGWLALVVAGSSGSQYLRWDLPCPPIARPESRSFLTPSRGRKSGQSSWLKQLRTWRAAIAEHRL